MTEYLTNPELSRRIKMSCGTIRNLCWKGDLRENVHFLQPTPRKVLFIWSAIEDWLHGKSPENPNQAGSSRNSLINI
jgi:hypothetical protein